MLTTIIKTKNNEDTLSETLESVKDLGEIIVVDEHSTDDTILLAKEYKAQIIFSAPNEFNSAFRSALTQAQNEWVLVLEGDEIIPQKLGNSILNYIENPKKNKNALLIPFKYYYLNSEIKALRGRFLRVFKKENAKLINNYSIELKPYKTKINKLKGSLKLEKDCILKFEKNDIFKIFQNMLDKLILQSKSQNLKGRKIFIAPFLKFLKRYFLKGALLNGRRGFIISAMIAIEEFIKRTYILEKSIKE
ncbi:glycosyltransferase family 2 protein [bacterium]|nr:glycosyltransferase family 2 protein [bacterium]